jgi:hypothetical protein
MSCVSYSPSQNMAQSFDRQVQNPQVSQFLLLKHSFVVTSAVNNTPLNWSHFTAKSGLTATFEKHVSNPPASTPVVNKMLLRVTHLQEVLVSIESSEEIQ